LTIIYLLALGLLTIICIYIYKIYLVVSKSGEEKMPCALQTCPNCNKEFIGPLSACPYCHYVFPKIDVPGLYVTSFSGQKYGPSSATTTYSPSFEELSDEFEKDQKTENAKKTREELLRKKNILMNLNCHYSLILGIYGKITKDIID